MGTSLKSFTHRRIAPLARRHKLPFMMGVSVLGALMIWGVMRGVEALRGPEKSKGAAPVGTGTVAVNVLEAKTDNFKDVMMAGGTIKGGSEIPLRFESEGPIDQFDFREGDKIRKGDVIARLNQREVYLKLKKARLELDQMEKLYAIGGVSLNKLEEARVQADLATSEMEKTVVRSPRDGVLGDKDAEVGEFVTPAKRIATLVSIDTVVVNVGVIEKEIDRIFPGQKVIVTVDTYSNTEFTGRVEQISPIVAPGSRTLSVEARLQNDGGLLLPGMFARVRITIFEQDGALSVPNEAVEKTAAGSRVYVVDKDNKAEAREVEVGYVGPQFSLISQGLKPGDLVVTQRPQDLKAGAPVKIIEKS